MRTARISALLAFAGLTGMTACGGAETAENAAEQEDIMLGPIDGHDLPGVDLERVRDGDLAPDFSLASYAGPVVTLSDFRQEKNVVLVFYRGHW
jgi:hypothetical protein